MDHESFFPSINQNPPETILINGKSVSKDNISLGDAAIVIANFRTLIFEIFSKEVQNGLKLKDVRDYNVYFFNSPGDSRTQIIFRDALLIESLKAVREAKTMSTMRGRIPQQNLSCDILQLEEEGGRIASYGTGTIIGADSLEEGDNILFEPSYQNIVSYSRDLGSNSMKIRKRVFDAMLDLEELSQELMTKPATSSIMRAVEKEMRHVRIPSVAAPNALSAPNARRISLFSDPATFAKGMHLLPTSKERFAEHSQDKLPAITKQYYAPRETASAASSNHFAAPLESLARSKPIIKGSMTPESEDEPDSESKDNQIARSRTIAAPAKSGLDTKIKPLSEPPLSEPPRAITTLFAISDDFRKMRLLPPLQERNTASSHSQGTLPPIQRGIPAITSNPNTTPPKLSSSASATIPKLILPQVSVPESEDESVSESDSDQAVAAKSPAATRVLKVEPAQIKTAPPADRKQSENILVEGTTQNTVVTRPYKLDPITQHQDSSSTPSKTVAFPYPDSKNVEAELARKEIVEEKAKDPLDEEVQYLDKLLEAPLFESTDSTEESAEHTIVEDARPITEKSNGFKIEISKKNTADAEAEINRILARLISSSKTKSVVAQAATPKKESGIDAENITADHIWNFARYIYKSYLEAGKKSTTNDKGYCGIMNRGTSTAANLDNIKMLLKTPENLLVFHCTKPNSLEIFKVRNSHSMVKIASFSQDKKADFYNVISSISAIKGLSDKQRDSILEHGEIKIAARKSEVPPITPKPPAISKPKTATARPRTSIAITRSEEAIKPHPPAQEFRSQKPVASSAHENPAPPPRTTTAIKRPISRASLASKPNSEQQSK